MAIFNCHVKLPEGMAKQVLLIYKIAPIYGIVWYVFAHPTIDRSTVNAIIR